MNIAVIEIQDLKNPVEVQEWLDNNPSITISAVVIQGYFFYIIY